MRVCLATLLLCPLLPAHAQDSPARWTLVEEMRIGSIDGPQALTRVTSVLVSPDGRYLYVGQPRERTVRMFDASSGRLLRTIGRSGAGPGEFNHVGRVGWKQDTLYVTDTALQRVTLFSKEGDHLRTERIVSEMLEATRSPAQVRALGSDGSVIGEPRISMRPIALGLVKSRPIVQMTREGKVIRTLTEMDVRNNVTEAKFGSKISVFSQPLSRTGFSDIAPDGSSLVVVHTPPATGSTAAFQVTRMRPNGDTLYHRSYRYKPRAIPEQVIDSIYNAYATGTFGSIAEPARAQQAARTLVKLPPFQPPVSRVVLASDGTVWLRRGERGLRTVQWLVLDAAGHHRATVIAPVGLGIFDAHQGRVWGVVQDDLDIPFVVRYRVMQPRGK